MTMFAIALALAAAPASPPPNAAAIRVRAAYCGIPAHWLVFGHDADGDFADVPPASRAPRLSDRTAFCLVGWANLNQARIGFISEPDAQELTMIPAGGIVHTRQAAEQCGLPVQIDPPGRNGALLLARRHAPPGPLACMRAWLTANRFLPRYYP